MASEHEAVRREIVLPVERERAWQLLCDPRELETWLADDVELDAVEPGAEGTVRWDGGEERHAVVEEVEQRRRVTLTWWEPGGEPSLVELTLDDVEDGTRLVVVELPLQRVRAVAAGIEGALRRASAGPQLVAA